MPNDIGSPEIETLLTRIDALSRAARTAWLSLLFVLVFIGVTLAGVKDADFFVSGRQTALPLLGVEVPTLMFFVGAPTLCAALFANLHFHLQKLWSALAPDRISAQVGETPLSDRLTASFIADLALYLRRDGSLAKHRLAALTAVLTFALLFLATPWILGWMWWRSMVSMRETLTVLACGLPLVLTLHVGAASFQTLIEETCATARSPWGQRVSERLAQLLLLRLGSNWRAAVLLLTICVFGWMRTEGTLDHYLGPDRIASSKKPWYRTTPFPGFLSSPDLTGVEFADLPDGWLGRAEARVAHRVTWCARNDLHLGICGAPDREEPALQQLRAERRLVWCAENGRTAETCPDVFVAFAAEQEHDFDTDRARSLAAIPATELGRFDLRGANLVSAILVRADLSGAQMEGAVLSGAQMEGANLRAAQMEGADLSGAQMEGAVLSGAQMEGANLRAAQMEGADLRAAQMEGANLRAAQMEGADLSGAQMEGADLRAAQMEGAVLWGAQMEGADLSGAQMEGANLRWAQMEGADLWGATLKSADLRNWTIARAFLRSADFTDSENLSQTAVNSAFGVASGIGRTILPEGLTPPAHWHVAEEAEEESFEHIEVARDAYEEWLATLPPESD